MKSNLIIFSAVWVFALTSCKHEPFPVLENFTDPVITPVVECDSDTVFFQNAILPIFISNCSTSGCHDVESHEDGVILVDYNSIMSTGEVQAFDPYDSEIYEVITETDDDDFMPPSPNTPLTSDQINQIFTWINQGALNNACSGCDTSQYAFALNVQPIITLQCKGCHSGGDPGGSITLVNYNDVHTLVLDGSLVDVLHHGSGDYADMPPNGGQISDCEIQVIENWIEAGALNN